MTMKALVTAICCAAMAASAASCSTSLDKLSGSTQSFSVSSSDTNYERPVVTRDYDNLASFDAIKASSGFDVTYAVGPVSSVKVEVSEIALPYIVVEVDKGVLRLGVDQPDKSLRNIRLKAMVTGPALSRIAASSGADITVTGAMTVSGGALDIKASSGADIEFEGAVAYSRVTADISSAADLEFQTLTADNVEIAASSGADAEVAGADVSGLSAAASSGADIELKGKAGSVSLKASSGADISASRLVARSGSAKASSGGSIKCNVADLDRQSSSGGSVSNKAR